MVKARDFDSRIRGFKSRRACQRRVMLGYAALLWLSVAIGFATEDYCGVGAARACLQDFEAAVKYWCGCEIPDLAGFW